MYPSDYIVISVGVGLFLVWVSRRFFGRERAVRGGQSQQNPIPKSRLAKPSIQDGYSFGGFPLSFDDARLHFLYLGSQGTGKSVSIRLLMQSVFYRMKHGSETVRALVYDSKTDLLSIIAGMDGVDPEQIIITNPLDKRCAAWDIARDIDNTMYAREFAAGLVGYDKTNGGENSYFFAAAEDIIVGVCQVLNHYAPLKWDLRDFLLLTLNRKRLEYVLESYSQTQGLVEKHFSLERSSKSVLASLDTYLKPLEPIAAAWHAGETKRQKFSIRDWVRGNGGILVLGNNAKAKEAILPLNRILFAEASKAVRSLPGESSDNQSWFFLDELSEMGNLPGLKEIMITGRSKGAPVVLGFQSVSGLEDNFGEKLAKEIIGQPQNACFLQINPTDPDTQAWASSCMGKWEFRRIEHGTSSTQSGANSSTTTSSQERYHIQERWLPSQFESDLIKPTGGSGLRALFRIRRGTIAEGFPPLLSGWFTQDFLPDILFGEDGDLCRLRPQHPTFQNFEDAFPPLSESEPRPEPQLIDWGRPDFERLGEVFWNAVQESSQKPKSSAPRKPPGQEQQDGHIRFS